MAKVQVLRTDGEEKELIEKFPNAVRLHIIAKSNLKDTEKDFGDFMTNEKFDNMFALIVKDDVNSKPMPEAVRLAILNLFTYLVEEDKKPEVLLMNYFEMANYKAENSFICILKELMLTYFGEAFENDITLIIYQYSKDSVTLDI